MKRAFAAWLAVAILTGGMASFVSEVFGREITIDVSASSSSDKVYSLGCLPTPPEVIAKLPKISYNLAASQIRSLPASVDHSASLPPVGNQGGQGSCVAWATGYYYKTFQEDQPHGSAFSPAFIYNQINWGVDGGAYTHAAFDLICKKGVANLDFTPYNENDWWTWPTEAAFDFALEYRAERYGLIWYNSSDITNLIGVCELNTQNHYRLLK